MTDILCRWLNEDLRLSQVVEPQTFAKTFSNGYLIGEVLHKYQLQKDFSVFMKRDTSVAKLNNFTRLEPTLQLLGISFNTNTAKELMEERQGVATRLIYQLYVSLESKKKSQISRTVMEITQPAAKARLHKKEHEIFSDRLHQVKRDADLALQKIPPQYEEKSQQWYDKYEVIPPIHHKRKLKIQDIQSVKNIEKVPKPPPYPSQLNRERSQRQKQRLAQEAQMVQTEIAQFEAKRKKLVTYGFASSSSGQPFPGDFPLFGSSQGCDTSRNGSKLILQSNSKYIQDIRNRLEENAAARERRGKRVDRFLVEQRKAHEAQEEAKRDELLVKRATRQTKQEQRLAAQLLQIRKTKEVIRENRLFREQQYQERREKDFQEALEREAALAQQAKLAAAEEIRMELEFCNRIAAERAQSRHKKHSAICKDIVEQIVDLATKVGEYRLLFENLIPEKLMREWKDLLVRGLPLYEPIKGQQPGFCSTPLDPVELEKQEILNNQDYDEYTNMVGEWTWPEEAGETQLPLTNNNILGHVVQRVRNIVHPPLTELCSPSFPHFTLKACVMGKFCSGKTSCLAKIAEASGIYLLSADTLIEEALNAYVNEEEATEQQRDKDNEQLITSSTAPKPELDTQEESSDSNVRRSVWAMLGAAAKKELKKGNAIPYELIVDIIVEAIKQVPAQSGWILDGFPVDITQAYLLEKALGGSVDVGDAVVSSRTNLVADSNPPKPPPPPVLDLALLLDIPDECVVRRAFSQTSAGTDTTAARTSDPTSYLAQVPHRITAFQDTWPKLEKWFDGKQNILVRVNANVDEEELYKRVESVLQQVMMRKQEDVVLESGKAQDSSSATFPPVDHPSDLTDEAAAPADSPSSLNEEKTQSVKSLSKSNTNSPGGHSRKASTSSGTNEDSQGVPTNPPESASPCPGSSSWVYVDEPLSSEITENLCSHWDAMCESYVNNIKAVMQKLRLQQTVITRRLYNSREDYKHYLSRPDLKQELVTQWQKDFNSIPDDMREDEETKAELHLRMDELCERMWELSDKRKEEDEQEKDALMGEGWLEDHTVVLVNYHSILMQVELDRFHTTLCILKVYYLSMYSQVLPELPSDLVPIHLLDTPEIKDPGERHPDSSGTEGLSQTEPVKPTLEKLISDYEEAVTAIDKSVSAEAQQVETKEQKKLQGEEQEKAPATANQKGKRKQSSKKKKGPPSPSPAPSPAPANDDAEKSHDQEVKNKIHKEYLAALAHEENAAKVRIALVKGHGLVMVHSLQSRVEQTLSSMQKCLEAHYVAEMKSIEQLALVARHHIEAGAKLQNQLVLEDTDFYLNGDCLMFASPPPPLRPPALERATGSTLTATQLQSLRQQLCTFAPSGLMSCFEFSSLLRDITSVTLSKDTLPEPWMDMNERQLMEIESLLTENTELIDCRRFLLSAALPWPFPSLTQLLVVLQRFKAADIGNTGYINEEQYLQTQLWFSNESPPVPEDPTEPLPYDRLANLRKFFFQLFADHSFSPPRLDYMSMLQYFAADPSPRQGFIRALSVVLGQHLKHSSLGHLVKSMPSIEEASELSTSELDGEYKEEETLCASSSSLGEQDVSIPALLTIICHKVTKMKDYKILPEGCLSQEEHTELVHVFREMGYKPEDCVPFSVLSEHPLIQRLMETSTQYQLVNIHRVLLSHEDEGETNSLTVS
ncbi:sperm flagellar protein 2 isoform X2 [Sparus aurata]|uniref:sperm flagellar protein 2 isoform X2 n=1 Tax=Sparus aurata TaxID=8175 RepID=UPI0011C12D9F|nr:sperm flagellar protein 2 isoform X2 [Sparus aurata]